MKLKTLTLLFFVIGALFYSCRRINCPQLETQFFYTRFSIEDTSFIPYNGNDTLWFQSNNGATMKLVCYEKYPYSKETCIDLSENPDCGSFWNCQVEDQYYIKFKSDDKKNDMQLILSKSNNFKDYLPEFFFSLNDYDIFGMNGLGIKKEFAKDSIIFKGNYIIGSLQTWDSIGLYDIDLGLLRFKDENSIVWTLTDKR
jgi:hypothetical protein